MPPDFQSGALSSIVGSSPASCSNSTIDSFPASTKKERIMEVLNITEKEDGSADLEIELTEEEQQILLSYAINNILKEFIEDMENK